VKRLSNGIVTAVFAVIITASFTIEKVKAEDYNKLLQKVAESMNSEYNASYDMNSDGIVDIFDMVYVARNYGTINVSRLKYNYVEIISPADKTDFEEIGFTFISDRCFPVTKEGINLFEYVDGNAGLQLEFIEGNDSFSVINDKLVFVGQAPAIARVRLVNPSVDSISEDFYIYGTVDREIHNFTYDYMVNNFGN
jgi:hypothetical protein